MCLSDITTTETANIGLIISCLELTRCLGLITITKTCSRNRTPDSSSRTTRSHEWRNCCILGTRELYIELIIFAMISFIITVITVTTLFPTTLSIMVTCDYALFTSESKPTHSGNRGSAIPRTSTRACQRRPLSCSEKPERSNICGCIIYFISCSADTTSL